MSTKWYEDRKAQGLCAWGCDRPAMPNRILCRPCNHQSKTEAKARWDAAKAAKVCWRCGKPEWQESGLCQSHCLGSRNKCREWIQNHPERYQEYELPRRAALRAQGICYRCTKNPIAETSKSQCRACLDLASERQERRKAKLLGRGLCFCCGKRPLAKTSTRKCRTCLNRYRQRGTT